MKSFIFALLLLGSRSYGQGLAGTCAAITGDSCQEQSSTTPDSLPGLIVWHDARQGVYSDVGCTTLATNGQKALCWKSAWTGVEKSTQAVAGSAPIYYSTAGPNGLPTIHFNNEYLQMHPSVTQSQLTVFIVGNKLLVGSGYFYPLIFDKVYWLDRFTTAGDFWGAYAGGEIPSSVTENATYNVRTMVLRAFNDIDLVTNGVVENKTNGGGLMSATASYIHSSAASMGNISELIVYSRALTVAERVSIEIYLKNKYGIAF